MERVTTLHDLIQIGALKSALQSISLDSYPGRVAKPVDKVIAGFVSQWHQTKFYKNMVKRESEQEFARITKMDEQLSETILAFTHAELNKNASLAKHDTKCVEIVLAIDAKYKESLGRVMQRKDFISYNLELIEENSDMRKAFNNMPIPLKITKKVVGGDD